MNNADDEIRLHLSLDETSIGTVESRVKQIVNQLGNQRLNITANLNGVNTAIKSLERLQEKVKELQNSTININANTNVLTPAQQQYRLETQRLQVAQRLSIEREKTAQSENRAVQALAQENRTLTRNYNINQQISGTIDHQHRRIQDLNNQTNNLTRTLSRGIAAYAGYKMINAMYSSLTNAFDEMKKIDSEMTEIYKVVDLTADGFERLEKSSYKIGQKYARSGSEYLKSVAAFSKAGYEEQSAELGELALLAQNSADMDADLSSQFLVSADAAWKYKGNVQELTKILDGFNLLSDKTAAKAPELASGLTVVGSLFAQAGLSAQDYASLVGTAEAKTQLSANQIARAFRQIVANLRQIKDVQDLETGEILSDDASLSKAEEALNSVGISIREVKDGITELRNPMEILKELASVWGDLSSIQKSYIQEGISNKRNANIFASVMENWEDVEKAAEIYANASGSALRENEIYLQSYQARVSRLQATWTSYISNVADMDSIKDSIDFLTGVVNLLDTSVGHVVTQAVLLVTTLNLASRAMQGLVARNIYAQIIQLGIAEGSLGTAIQMVTADIIEQGAAFAASPLGILAITIMSVVAAVKIYDTALQHSYKAAQQQAEASQELIDKYDKEISSLEDLQSRLQDAQGDKNALAQISSELNGVIGKTPGLINGEAKAYETANVALEKRLEYLRKVRAEEEKSKIAAVKQEFNSATVDRWGLNISARAMRTEARQLQEGREKWLPKAREDVLKNPKNANLSPDEFNKAVEDMLDLYIAAYVPLSSSEEQFNKFFEDEFELAKEALDNTLSSYEGSGGRSFLEQILHKLVFTGSDMDEIEKIIGDIASKGVDLNDAEKEYLESLTNEGADSEEKLKIVSGLLDELKEKYPQLTSVLEDYYAVISSGNEDIQKQTDEAVSGISTLATMLSDVAGGNKQKNIKALANAYKDMAQNSVLSIDTVSDLLEQYPELEDKIITTADGYKIEKSSIEEVIDAMLEKYRLEIEQSEQSIITQANTLEEAGKLDIEREKYDSLSEAIYNAVKMKLALISTPEYAVGKNFDAWQSDYKQYSEMLQTMDDIRERRKSLDSLKGSLYEDVFGNGDKTIRDNTKKYKDYSKKISDLDKKVNLDKTKYELDTTALSIERIDNAVKALEQTLDLTADDDYITRITTTSQQLDLARQKASMLSAEFAQLQNEEYNSADAAKELANRMQSTADEIAENQKNIIKYGKNIAEYYTSALTSISSLSKAHIDQATKQIDKNIKALSEGGLVGIEFTMSPTIPKSAVEKQRQQNKTLEDELKAHYETVANMQKIALDLQYQETVEENARQREELVNSLNEIKGMLNSHSSDVQTSQKAADKATLDEEKKSNKEREAETQRFVNSEKQIVTSLNDWLKQNPIVAPSLDTSAWEQMVSKAESYAQRVKDAFTGAGTVNALNINKDSDISNLARGAFGNGRNALVEAARSQVGYKANAGKYNKFSEFGVGYGYAYNSAEDWCNDFTSWAAVMAGLDDVIPIGAGTIDTAERFKKNLKSAKNYTPKIGDIAYYGSSDSIGGIYHVEIVSGFDENGKLITIGGNTSGGKVVERVRSDYPKFFGTYYNGTGKFNYDGIAGETYETEYIIDKKTGAVTEVDTPTLVDTDKQAVVGVEQSKKIKQHQYKKGTIPVPNGLGKEYTYMAWDTITNMDTEEGRLIKTFGKNYDSEGYGKIGNRYALAMTSTFGNIGDAVDVYMSDGRIIRGVLAEEKSQVVTPWDKSPANEWGHKNGNRVVEWVTNWTNHDNPESNGSVLKVENLGSVFDNSDLASISDNISSIATDTAKIATPNFKEQIRAITDKDIPTSQRTQFEGDLLEYIKQNTDIQTDIDNELLSSWSKLQAYNTEQKENFKGYEQQLLDLVGSDGFVEYRTQLSQTTDSYLKELMREQTDITVKGIKQSFEQAKDIQDTILAYYYKRESEGATADELKVIRESWETQSETVQSLSDSYVSAISSYTDYVVAMADREMRAYDERALWQSKINDELERELNRTEDSGKRADIINKILDGYEKQNDIYETAKTAAHNGVLALYDNENYTPIFREFDLESWFDAQADFTAQFENDLSRIAITAPELVPIMNEVAKRVQTYKKEWLEVDEAIKSNEDSIYNLNKTLTSGKIERYTKNLERLNAIDNVRMSKENALAAAMEKRNNIMQSTRKDLADIKAEVDANMHTEQYLDKDTRRLIYNTEDYEKQRKDIESIQDEAERLYKRYQKDLASLNETEYFKESQITDEYNKQLDALNEKLAVSKQQLENTKKQLAYENGLKERDTRIIVGGHAVMVADPDRMYNLAKERSQAESELQNTILTNSENENVRDTQRIAESINQEIVAREKMVDLIGKMSDVEAELFSKMLPAIEELELFGNMLSEINVPWLNAHSREYREQFEDLPSIYKVNGYNLSYDYHAGHDIVNELSSSGIISDEIAKAYDRQLESQHNLKASTDLNTAQYPTTSMYGGKQYSAKYAMNDDEILKAYRDNTVSDYAAEIAEIIRQSSGNPSNREQERLRLLETLRNRKIFLEGLDYEQSDRYGGIKFLDNQADYAEALSYIEEYAKEGLEKADLRKVNEQMNRWEQLRKEKLDKLNETGEWNKENLDTVVSTMEGDGVPIEDGTIVEVGNADEIGQAIGSNINVNVSADSGGKSSNPTTSQPKQQAGEIARGDYSKTGYTTSDKLKVNKYANGTDDAEPGWAITDEEGYEFKLKKLGDQYRLLQGHEKIFTADMTENLKNFSMNPPNFIQDMIDKTNTQMMNVITTNNNNNPTTLTQTFTGDIVVPDNGKKFDEYMGSLIRQASGKSDITKNLSRYS